MEKTLYDLSLTQLFAHFQIAENRVRQYRHSNNPMCVCKEIQWRLKRQFILFEIERRAELIPTELLWQWITESK